MKTSYRVNGLTRTVYSEDTNTACIPIDGERESDEEYGESLPSDIVMDAEFLDEIHRGKLLLEIKGAEISGDRLTTDENPQFNVIPEQAYVLPRLRISLHVSWLHLWIIAQPKTRKSGGPRSTSMPCPPIRDVGET